MTDGDPRSTVISFTLTGIRASGSSSREALRVTVGVLGQQARNSRGPRPSFFDHLWSFFVSRQRFTPEL